MVFKYLLMYIFVTNVETGGQIWRLLFNRLLVSTVLFQLLMIAVLNLKSAKIESLAVAPLPIITILFKIICNRRFDPKVYYYTPNREGQSFDRKETSNTSPKGSVSVRFGDPAFFAELPIPMVHERVRHLLPKLYHTNITNTLKKPFVSRMTRQKSVRQVSVIHLPNGGKNADLQFQSVGEKDLELDDSEEGARGMYKFNEDDERDNIVEPTNTNYYGDYMAHQGHITNPMKRISHRISASLHRNDTYRQPLVRNMSTIDGHESEQFYDGNTTTPSTTQKEDMEYFVAGRAYKTHNPHDIMDDSNVIEMANIYRSQQTPYEHHNNRLVEGYNQYVRTPINAYTTGNGRFRNHPDQQYQRYN